MQQRKYEIVGTDDLNDVHIFMTDNRQRAKEVAEAMREDLEKVELFEDQGASQAIRQERPVPNLAEQNFAIDPGLDSGL